MHFHIFCTRKKERKKEMSKGIFHLLLFIIFKMILNFASLQQPKMVPSCLKNGCFV